MACFFMFGKFPNPERKALKMSQVAQIEQIVKQLDGKVEAIYQGLGAYDVILICQFPDLAQALQASVQIGRELEISFSTMPAFTAEEFDRLVGA